MTQAALRPTLSHQLADFVAQLSISDLPPSVVDDARWRLVDTVGVALAGSRMDFAAPLREMVGEAGGRPEASCIGLGPRLPAPAAGFVNGAYAHGPDYDDTHSVAMVHIGCLVVPASLAVGERVLASGERLLTALVAGAEIGLRIGAAAPHRFHMRGYHATGVVGPFAAATTAGLLLGLDPAALTNALGLCGSQAAGLMQGLRDGSWVKRLHPGWSVRAGIEAALLGQRGFLGQPQVLEGSFGLYATLLHGDPQPPDLESICADLGHRWLLPETTYKPYSSGAWNHSSMDAVVAIMHRAGLTHRDIEAIEVEVPAECMPVVCEPREAKIHPSTPYHMKFSLPYSVAILAVLGHADIDDYSDEVLADRTVADLAARITCREDPTMSPEGFPAKVTLRTRDGRSLREEVPHQRGGPGNPMKPEDHRGKFRANATPSLGEEGSDRLLAALEHVADLGSVATLAPLLARTP